MPSPHPTSSHSSAHTSSGDLPFSTAGNSYTLGEYTFELSVRSIPQTDLVSVIARAEGPEGKMGSHSIEVPASTEIKSWSVEANETEASVYATIKNPPGPIPGPIGVHHGSAEAWRNKSPDSSYQPWFVWEYDNLVVMPKEDGNIDGFNGVIFCSKTPGTGRVGFNQWGYPEPSQFSNVSVTTSYTYNGKTVYYYRYGAGYKLDHFTDPVNYGLAEKYLTRDIAWDAIYANDNDGPDEQLVARFAIDMREADPGSWDEPGDDGDPDLTLDLTVIGALSGRHNDPLTDPSYSYVPADKATVKDYGCGGDGGHGGGGGGGASTIIAYHFGTDKASSHEVITIARRHGYGSGGGKGGKGGDGCILIYY